MFLLRLVHTRSNTKTNIAWRLHENPCFEFGASFLRREERREKRKERREEKSEKTRENREERREEKREDPPPPPRYI